MSNVADLLSSPLAATLAAEAIKDGPGLVRSVIAAFGEDGHAKVQAILDAEIEAARMAVDVLEQEAIDRETKP